jgi:hypothetical protein
MQYNPAAELSTDDFRLRAQAAQDQFITGERVSTGGNVNFALGKDDMKVIGFIDHINDLLDLRLGIASTDIFSAGLMYTLDRSHGSYNDNNAPDSTFFNEHDESFDEDTINTGNGIGLFGSIRLGDAGDLYGNALMSTGPYQQTITTTYEDTNRTDTRQVNRRLALTAGFARDAQGEEEHAFDLRGSIIWVTYTVDDTGGDYTTDTSNVTFYLRPSYGYSFIETDDFAVYVGTHLTGMLAFNSNNLDDISRGTSEGSSIMYASLSPNLSFQKVLGKGFDMQFGGSADLIRWQRRVINISQEDADPDKRVYTDFSSPTYNVSLGLRWTYEDLAVEGTLNQTLMRSGPNFISGGTNDMFGHVGISLGF